MHRGIRNGRASEPCPGHHVNQNSSHVPRAWDHFLPVPKFQLAPSLILVSLAAGACYVNSYDGAFVFDDSEAILNNKDLQPGADWTDVFLHDFWGGDVTSNTSHKSYRPLTVLTFRLNSYFSGGLHPCGFHVTNIILHILVCCVMLRTYSVLLTNQLQQQDGRICFQAPRAALLATLLFALHPVHAESVAGVVGRADLLCALTFLLSFLCYVRACHSGGSPAVRPTSVSPLWLTLSMILCSVSVLFKEQGITVLGLCSVYDLLVQCRLDLLQLLSCLKPRAFLTASQPSSKTRIQVVEEKECSFFWVKSLVLRHVCLLLTGVLVLFGRWKVMGSQVPHFQPVDNPHSFIDDLLFRVINYNYIYSLNLWILLNPLWLCFDWSMGCVPVINTFTDPRILAALIFLVCLVALILIVLRQSQSTEIRILGMSLALLIVPFLPASNLFFRVGFVIAERVLYLPSAGICLLLTLGLRQICFYSQPCRKLTHWALPVLLLLFLARSIQRSAEWRTELSLFESGDKVCPLNAKVQYNIAKVHGDAGNTVLAIQKYTLAIELNPEYDQAMNNLGNIYKDQGNLVEAESLLTRATQCRPDFAAAWMNLGVVQASLGKANQSELSYKTALRHRRKYPDCYYNLGNLYLDERRFPEALQAWRNATLLKPGHTSAWSNLLILLDNLGQVTDLKTIGKEALSHLPQEPSLHYNLANALGKAKQYEESEAHFLSAIRLDANNAQYYANLGVLYHRWGKLEEAKEAYEQALKIDPMSQQTSKNLLMLKEKKSQSAKLPGG